ncbi:MAG: hypothetical protein KDJ50_09165 [Alphaproteobacteria bacterium]|nr:hypothetical protein [Alphaproteobacteria bacterium]
MALFNQDSLKRGAVILAAVFGASACSFTPARQTVNQTAGMSRVEIVDGPEMQQKTQMDPCTRANIVVYENQDAVPALLDRALANGDYLGYYKKWHLTRDHTTSGTSGKTALFTAAGTVFGSLLVGAVGGSGGARTGGGLIGAIGGNSMAQPHAKEEQVALLAELKACKESLDSKGENRERANYKPRDDHRRAGSNVWQQRRYNYDGRAGNSIWYWDR